MKEWEVTYTYLDTFLVPDDWGYDEVMKWAKSNPPEDMYDYNDIEIFNVSINNIKNKEE